MRRLCCILPILLLAACSPSPYPSPSPTPRPTPSATPVLVPGDANFTLSGGSGEFANQHWTKAVYRSCSLSAPALGRQNFQADLFLVPPEPTPTHYVELQITQLALVPGQSQQATVTLTTSSGSWTFDASLIVTARPLAAILPTAHASGAQSPVLFGRLRCPAGLH